jgi:hypothetical protein
LEIEKMLMAFLMLHHFQHTAGLTFKFGGKILTVMEYMIKMMRVQTFAGLKNSTVVLILMETESR